VDDGPEEVWPVCEDVPDDPLEVEDEVCPDDDDDVCTGGAILGPPPPPPHPPRSRHKTTA
jgi:hypothetical protein